MAGAKARPELLDPELMSLDFGEPYAIDSVLAQEGLLDAFRRRIVWRKE